MWIARSLRVLTREECHREKLKNLLTELGIGFSEPTEEDFPDIVRCNADDYKNNGYIGFYTDFQFDKDGKLLVMGAFE